MNSRGVKQPKLKDLSQKPLNTDELRFLLKSVMANSAPIVIAILGAVLVEHELEVCIRRRTPRKDDETWFDLLDERGPLSTFSRKILAGYSLRLYDDDFRTNMDVVRAIRNGFAHSKRIIDFKHPAVTRELDKIVIPATKRRAFSYLKKLPPHEAYPQLCLTIAIELMKLKVRWSKAASRRVKKKFFESPLVRALGSQFTPESYKNFQKAHPEFDLQLTEQNQISGPNALALAAQHAGMIRVPKRSDGK